MVTIYLFHRDLRLVDHYGLEKAVQLGNPILPLFVFTKEQTMGNKLYNEYCVQFMLESLDELDKSVCEAGGQLIVAYGNLTDILRTLHARISFSALVDVADYTPYAKKRTTELSKLCGQLGIDYHSVHDSYLIQPGYILNKSGHIYQKFTPFYEAARTRHIPTPHGKPHIHWFKMPGSSCNSSSSATRKIRKFAGQTSLGSMWKLLVPIELPTPIHGGRSNAISLLHNLPTKYALIHDIPSEHTSMLSAHNHFGTVSIREVYTTGRKQPEFIRQLWWRDFYGHIMNDFENLYGVHPYEFQKIGKSMSAIQKKAWHDWCNGTTGIPIIDAGINELMATGYMHNRIRLVVASWLVKDMGIHWRLGERFFATHLIDYDPTQNMMNWIWVASVLPFASAPFRRLDPERTIARFDPDKKYIDKWLVRTPSE